MMHSLLNRCTGIVATFIVLMMASLFVQAETGAIAIPKPGVAPGPESAMLPVTAQNFTAADSRFSGRIVGGVTARRGEFPEFVQLFIDGAAIGQDPNFIYSWCGGSLISTNKVLTAGHCTSGINAGSLYALPNFYSFNDNITFRDLIPVSIRSVHPRYGWFTDFNYDVSVLTLRRPSSARQAKLFTGNIPLKATTATVIGTGALAENGTGSTTLRKVSIPVVSNIVCQASYGESAITQNMLCAGLKNGKKDSCQGDSGGPLWINHRGVKSQAGIVSWGNGCARPNYYGVYARTSALIDYILKHAPNAQVVEANVVDVMPFVDMLLFKEITTFAEDPPGGYCHGGTINLDESVITNTEYLCSNTVLYPQDHYKIFNFSLIEKERITIRSAGSNRNAVQVELYSDTNGILNLIETARGTSARPGETFMINDLPPGKYTVIVRTYVPSHEIELSLIKNKCDFSPIALDVEKEFIFQKNCQDTAHTNPFVSYHSFSLPSEKDVNITASAVSDKRITLYRITNGQLTYISGSSISPGEVAIHRNKLAMGDYVIKVRADVDKMPITLKVNTINCVTTDTIGLEETKTISFPADCKTLSNRYQFDLIATLQDPMEIVITSDRFFLYKGFIEPLDVNNESHVLSLSLDPGTHKITAYSDFANTTQSFSFLEKKCQIRSISVGGSASIDFSDACRHNGYYFADYRTFSISKNSTVKITAKASELKYITLLSGSGDQMTELASDINSGNTDAVIEENLIPGIYTIRSKTDYKDKPFMLTVEEIN